MVPTDATVAGAAEIDTRTADDTIKKRRWAYGIMAFFAVVSIGTYAYNEYYIYLSVKQMFLRTTRFLNRYLYFNIPL